MINPSSTYDPKYYISSNPNNNFTEVTNRTLLNNRYYNKNVLGPNQLPYSNFDNAFPLNKNPSNPIIERQQFVNPNTTLHNNLNNNLQRESIKEYVIELDSLNRNSNVYLSPYKYTVLINQNSTEYTNNGKMQLDSTIVKNFKNIRYINVNSVILPIYSNIIEDDENPGTYIFDVDSNMAEDRFFMLKLIDNFDSVVYSNNSFSDRKGIRMSRHKLYGNNFYKAVKLNDTYTYDFKNSYLGQLKRLDIEFFDDTYNPIHADVDPTINDIDDLRCPLNRYRQNLISLTIGVVETELNTQVSYYQ